MGDHQEAGAQRSASGQEIAGCGFSTTSPPPGKFARELQRGIEHEWRGQADAPAETTARWHRCAQTPSAPCCGGQVRRGLQSRHLREFRGLRTRPRGHSLGERGQTDIFRWLISRSRASVSALATSSERGNQRLRVRFIRRIADEEHEDKRQAAKRPWRRAPSWS